MVIFNRKTTVDALHHVEDEGAAGIPDNGGDVETWLFLKGEATADLAHHVGDEGAAGIPCNVDHGKDVVIF